MGKNWTYGQKLAVGFAATVSLAVVIGIVATVALRSVVSSKDRVITGNAQLLVDAGRLSANSERKGGEARAFLLTGEGRFVERLRAARSDLLSVLERLKQSVSTEDERKALELVGRAEAEQQAALDQVIEQRKRGATAEAAARQFEEQVVPKRAVLDEKIKAFVDREEALLAEARDRSTKSANLAIWLVAVIAVSAVLVASLAAAFLTRALASQVGTTVSQVQSSSAELQAAANQQATGAREHATAMNEIATTISELLATSRQIAESAQRVAHVAEQTAAAARSGDTTVETTYDSIAGIRRQIDLVVAHMLDLGRKSQQIGAILDIVSELAEQTNILAINATIEAAGAGDAGKRFSVVADEIRKLADRVGGSTKEIRGLIDDVRSSVNTTVMATESGSKAVDSGTKQFGDVASSFKQIAGLVSTTTEAAREIELSTKQQATAVEQVNVAISNITLVTRDSESSSIQTLQTASQLAELSRQLLRLVQPQTVS